MLEESRDRIVPLYHALRREGAEEFDGFKADRSFCIYEKDYVGPIEQVFQLVYRRYRDMAEIELRMPPPGDLVEVVLDGQVKVEVEVDLRDPEHLLADGMHVEAVDGVAQEIMEQARLALEE